MHLPIDPLAATAAAVHALHGLHGLHGPHLGPAPWPGALPGHAARLAAASTVSLAPDPGQLPGGSTLQRLTNGVGGWALVLALVGMVVGAAAWALGAHSQNFNQSFLGRRTVLISGLAALVIGAAPALVNFFFHAGQGVH